MPNLAVANTLAVQREYKGVWRKLFKIAPILFAIFLLMSGKSQSMVIIIYDEMSFFQFSAISVRTFFKDSHVKKKEKKSPIPPSHKHWVVAIKVGDHQVLQPGPGFIIFQWPRRTFALIWLMFPPSCHWLCWLYLKRYKEHKKMPSQHHWVSGEGRGGWGGSGGGWAEGTEARQCGKFTGCWLN